MYEKTSKGLRQSGERPSCRSLLTLCCLVILVPDQCVFGGLVASSSLPLLSFPEVRSFGIHAFVHSSDHPPGGAAAAVRSTCPRGVRWVAP